MLRRNIRLRKEYLLKKSLENKENQLKERRLYVKRLNENAKVIPALERDFEFQERQKLDLVDARSCAPLNTLDDEYAYAGVKDPKIMLTTSRDPSNRLQQFVKELNLIFPNAHRLNRGNYILKDLVRLAQSNEISDIVIVHEHRGIPDGLVVSHMPLGPTIYFSLHNVVLRHDLPNKPPPMSTVFPHLIFDNFTSTLGRRVSTILKYLFPPASPSAQRVFSFMNVRDFIHFRHFVWEDKRSGFSKEQDFRDIPDQTKKLQENTELCQLNKNQAPLKDSEEKMKCITLTEIGPRFALKPYRIALGTLDMKNVQLEWSLKPYFNKPHAALSI